jgi:two-component system sensor histidine kinase KdpD
MQPRPTGPPGRYLWATLLVLATTGLAAAVRRVFPPPEVAMLYLLVVLVAAVYLGRGPSLLAAALGVAAYDFFFVAPTFTFAVGDTRYVLTFGMMFGVGLVVSSLAARIRRQETEAQHREERARTLYALTHELGSAKSEREIAAVACQNAALVFAPQAWVVKDGEGGPQALAAYPLVGTIMEERELAAAREVLRGGGPAGQGTAALPEVRALAVPLAVGAKPLAALVLRPEPGAAIDEEQRRFLESFCRQVALALSRLDFDERARQADLRARAEEMRSALLSAVSHDLRTPLAGITGAATTLRDNPGLPGQTREEMLATICEESERLKRLVSNLLDMTRLESGAVQLKRDWLPADEVVGSALTRLDGPLGNRPVVVDVPGDLPLLWVDPVMIEQLLVNLLENAIKHTPAGTGIEITGSVSSGKTILEIADRGAGIRAGDEERIFERFFRRSEPGVPGVGLGLAICRAIALAHGGTLSARNRISGGAAFRLVLPAPAVSSPTADREAGATIAESKAAR